MLNVRLGSLKIRNLILVLLGFVLAMILMCSGNESNATMSSSENGVTVIFSDDGTLTVYGSGEITSYLIQKLGYPNSFNKDNIKNVVINSGITGISYHTFENCRNLSSISLPNTIKYIYSGAFEECSSLKTINIPSSVETIDIGCFYGCTSLTSINVSISNTSYYSEDGVLFQKKGEKSLWTYPAGKSDTHYAIPMDISHIPTDAFNSTKLKYLHITDNIYYYVEGIGKNVNTLTLVCKSNSRIVTKIKELGKKYITDDISPTITASATIYKKGTTAQFTFSDGSYYWYGWNVSNSAETPTTWNRNLTYDSGNGNGGYLNYSFNTEGTYYIHAIDGVGNTAYKQIKVDGTAPTISSVTGNPTSWATSATLRVTATDSMAGIASYSFDGGTTWQTSNSKTYTSNTSGIQIKVKDKAGNIATYGTTINITKIDRTAPTVTHVEPSANYRESNKDITVQVIAVDIQSGGGSGSGVTSYSFDGGTTWQSSNTKTYTATTKNIEIKVKDKVGNVGTYGSTIDLTIDKSKPTIQLYKVSDNTKLQSGDTIEKDTEMKLMFIDNKEIEGYKITNNEQEPSTWNTEFDSSPSSGISIMNNVKFSNEGRNYIWAKDSFGNTSYAMLIVGEDDKTDNTPPTITLETEVIKKGESLQIAISDEESYFAGWQVTSEDEEPATWNNNIVTSNGKTGTITYEFLTEGTNYIWVKDSSGNIAKASINVDGTAPEIILENTIEDEGKEITIQFSDENGVAGWQITETDDEPEQWQTNIQENSVTYTVEKGTRYIWAKDTLGNIGYKEITSKGEAPAITGVEDDRTYKDESIIPLINSDYDITSIVLKKDGEEVDYTEGNEISEVGEYELTVTDRKGASTKVEFKIIKLEGIAIESAPTKTTYIQNWETLEISGGKIKLIYSDDSEESIDMNQEGVEVSGFNNSQLGTNTITVTYMEKETTFDVEIVNKSLLSINIDIEPTKTTYIQNSEELDLTGGKLKLTYNDYSNETIDMTANGVEIEGFDNSQLGTNTITVKYGEKEATFEVTIVEKELVSISIEKTPSKTKYIQNYETLSLARGKIKLAYNDESEEIIDMTAEGVKVTGFDNSKLGTNTITVKYEGKTATFNVTIVEKSLTSMNIDTEPTKTTYIQNYEELDLTGGKLKLKYSDNSENTINMTEEGVEVEGFDNSKLGQKTITVIYEGKTATFNITIVKKEVEKMAIYTEPNKTTYIKNYEKLNLQGGKIAVKYNDGSIEIIDMESEEVEVEGFDNSKLGTNTIKVTYGGKTQTFDVTIVEKALKELAIESYPKKRKYIENGEELDLTGGKLKLVYSDDSESKIDMTADGVKVESFDNSKIGKSTVTLKYGEKSVTFDVTIEAKSLSSISISKLPTKTTYIQNYENLDLTGGELKLVYNNNSEEVIDITDESVEVTGFDNSKIGKNTITVKYEGEETTFDVQITSSKIQPELSIEGLPENMTKDKVTLVIEVSCTYANLESVKVNENEIIITDGVGKYEVTENGTYTIVVKDSAGNETREEVVIDKIYKSGDLNGTGKPDTNDLLKVMQHIVAQRTEMNKEQWTLSEEKQIIADVNQDGKIDQRDVLKIKRFLAATRSEEIASNHPDWLDM